ncbi:hypothetical protein RHO13_00910 [Orbus wheelerorum]|uniref:hypothetical protein n=1 Tax=Orbus wheelerorum TaxID=3074111 RepID=UPI00370D639B
MTSVNAFFYENMTTFTYASGEKITLQVGYKTLASTHFKDELPTPYETELAIIVIENAIEDIYSKWQKVDTIITDNEQVYLMIDYFTAENQIDSIQVERLFNRLADVISGSPKQELVFFSSPYFIATLLILREIIHHLGINTIKKFKAKSSFQI